MPHLFWLVLLVLVIVALWYVFTKAGKPGWAAIIPFYNAWAAWEVAGKPGWWMFLFFIPIVQLVFWVILCLQLAPRFSKGTGFAVGLVFLPFIFLPIMGFDSSKYIPPAAPPPSAAKPQ